MQKIKASELSKIIEHENKADKKHHFGSIKAGYRDDLGFAVASSWEANISRYLLWLADGGFIKSWEYEPQTFEFAERHGTTRYTPDFKITNPDDSIEYWEVKGYMDRKSKTKIKRFRRDYSHLKLVIIDGEAYRAIEKWKHLVPGWES